MYFMDVSGIPHLEKTKEIISDNNALFWID
jgi:hypothetical protein